MATNVLELRRFNPAGSPAALAERVSVTSRADIAAAAALLGHAAHALGLRIMVWHDLASLEAMRDADGAALNPGVLGWGETELAPWQCRDRMLGSPLLRACRVESAPFRVSRKGIETRWPNRLADQIGLDDFKAQTGMTAAIAIPVLRREARALKECVADLTLENRLLKKA